MATRTAKEKEKVPGLPKAGPKGIRPIGDRVLIRAREEEKTRNGIIIPDTAAEKPQEGRVIAVGPGRVGDGGTRIAPGVTKGDRVLYGRFSGTDVKIDGEEYVILRESDILAIL